MEAADRPGSGLSAGAVDAEAFSAFESAGWERQAPTYGDFLGQITRGVVTALLDAADVTRGSRVLDVATGPGYAAAAAHARGASVVGVDVAEAMVQLAGSHHPEIDFQVADAEALPFEDDSFDAVVSNFVVPHLGRPEQAVGELARVLRVGGALALTTWDQPERMRLLGLILEAVARAGATPPHDIPPGPPFFRFSDDQEFDALLRGSGLTGVKVTTIAFIHRVEIADAIWDGVLTSTVRTRALITHQPEATRQRIRAAFDEQVVAWRHRDTYEIPISVKLASGRKDTGHGG